MLFSVPRIVVAISTVVALAAGTLLATESAEAAPSAQDVPAIDATALTQPKVSAPAGTFEPDVRLQPTTVADPATVTGDASFDSSSASVTDRDEYTTTRTDDDGISRTTVSALPVNVKDGNKWVASSTTLAASSDGWSDEKHPVSPSFSRTASDDGLLSVERGGHTVAFTLEGAEDAAGEKHGDVVEYGDVFAHTDLRYSVDRSSVKESIVLDTAPKVPRSYVWALDTDLTPVKNDHGDIEFQTATGSTAFLMPVPVMWDSSGWSGIREPAFTAVDYTLDHTATGWKLTLTPSAVWLTDPARVYPVTVDPTVTPGGDNTRSYKSDGTPNTGHALIGNTRQNNGNYFWRTTVHYNYEQLFGYQILGARMNTSYYEGTTACYGMWMNWANNFAYSGVGDYLGAMTNCGGSATSGDMGQYPSNWVNARASGAYFMLRGDESAAYTYKGLNTSMSFDYVGFPSVTGVTGLTPVNGARASVTPIMQGTGSDPAGGGLGYRYDFSTDSSFNTVNYSSPWVAAGPYQVPQGALAAGTKYYYRVVVYSLTTNGIYGTNTVRSATNANWNFTTNIPAPTPPQAQVQPGNGTIVTSLAPTFSTPQVVDPNGDQVRYQFRVSTGTDGRSGNVIRSGWLTPTGTDPIAWTPPAGSLQDGGNYTLSVLTDDSIDTGLEPSWYTRFTVNQRIGDAGPAPTDTAGPVTVNLANGNASLSFASPTVSTLGGPMGLSFSYNSLVPSTKYQGLTGSFYNALNAGQTSTSTFSFDGRTPLITRTDPQVSFTWGTDSPAPAVPADYFLAKWTGFIRIPATGGPYTLGTSTDDGSKLIVGTSTIVNNWQPYTLGSVWAANANATPNGAILPIEYSYFEATGPAYASLMVKDGAGQQYPVPASWLTTTYLPMPAGWASSTPLTGSASAYSSAAVTESAIVLTDSTGATHSYAKKSDGGYAAPDGEYGTASLTAQGMVNFVDDDGTVYTFDSAGRTATVTSPSDSTKTATPRTTSDSTTGRLASIFDPVAPSRTVKFAYTGDTATKVGLSASDTDGSGSACPVPAGTGYTAAANLPQGLLCRIIYPGHVAGTADTTQLFYNDPAQVCLSIPAPNRDNACWQIAEIRDPGAEITTFGYDSDGRLNRVRDSLINDWLTVPGHTPADTNQATLAYTLDGRLASVTLPAPDGVTASKQVTKRYTYASGETYVDIDGADLTGSPIAHSGKVTYNSLFQQTSTTTAMGLTSTQQWSAKDQLLRSTDPTGLTSTTIYDPRTDRPTDTYGPAPSTCFDATGLPIAGCAITPAHTKTGYDETSSGNAPLQGLNTVYYNTASSIGAPSLFSLGLLQTAGATVASDGRINANWGTNPIGPGLPADWASIRMNGTITFPTAGTYTLKTTSDDTSRVWLNDVLVVDNQTNATDFGATPITVSAGETRRIRIEYVEKTGTAWLKLSWVAPGSTAVVDVPGGALKPDYGLTTSATVDDGPTAATPTTRTQTGYGANPWLGQATSSTVDPGGLALTSSSTFEPQTSSANSWLRQLTRTLPAGTASTSTNSYYTDTATLADATCGVAAGTPQAGMLKTIAGATPASGAAIVTSYVYDWYGRVAGTKLVGDADWACVTFDLRGRTISRTSPATTTAPSRSTVSSNYAVGGDPLTTSTTDDAGTVTAVTDLLGRSVSYIDVWGAVTVTNYDPALDRVISISTTVPGRPASVLTFSYDLDGKLTAQKLGSRALATVSYAPSGPVSRVDYANGTSLSALERDAAGRITTSRFDFGGGTLTDTRSLSQAGRVTAETIAPGGEASATSTYSYDGAGRLISAAVPGHNLSYGFGPATCGNVSAGKNGNRTSFTDVQNTPFGTATHQSNYCYDSADRLTASAITNPASDANPVAGSNLSTVGVGANLAYDGRGNSVRLANQTVGYDSANRHISTTTPAAGARPATSVTYTRDASGRIVREATESNQSSTVTTYYFTGPGDSPAFSSVGVGTLERTISLPGGVTASVVGSTTGWTYPNLHGDVVTSADDSGVRGVLYSYDPFGNPIDPTTGNIGGTSSDDAVPTNPTGTSYGWAGTYMRNYQHAGDISTIEMGARQYLPILGRFLSTDPVAGGTDNDYSYPNDPINSSDYNGLYSYRYDWKLDGVNAGYRKILRGYSAAGAMALFQKYPSKIFPFPVSGCSRLVTGAVCTLAALGPAPGSVGKVRVTATSTSVTFTVISGKYFDPPGSQITFSTYKDSAGDVHLVQQTSAKARYGYDPIAAPGAWMTWSIQASNLRSAMVQHALGSPAYK